MAETYVYASRIKELAKKHGLRMSGGAAEALNAQIVEMVKAAAERAAGNKRKTIYPFDF
jgi:histone H3/H4